MPKRKRIKVVYTKLGRQKIWGQADSFIEIDIRAKGKKLMELLHHESLHVIFPDMSEDDVERTSIMLTNLLWEQGFRRCDNSNDQLLQDGRK